jgi:hypothetical protein
MTLVITLKTDVKIQKYPQILTLVFVLSKAKTILLLYMNNEKTKKILVQQPNNILILEEKKIFLLFKNL